MKAPLKNTQESQKNTVQRVQQEPRTDKGGEATIVDNRPTIAIQRKLRSAMGSAEDTTNPIQYKNKTGLPDKLKSGIENLSGYSMDDVKVHYNSSKPAQLHAHAYAQGTDIHLASGQEKHLPHEAWHVIQQKQGRVKPTRQLKSKVNINDDAGLEKEADVMGARAMENQRFSKGRLGVLAPKQLTTAKAVHQLKIKRNNKEVNSVQDFKHIIKDDEGININQAWIRGLLWSLWIKYGKNESKHIQIQDVITQIELKETRGDEAFKGLIGGTGILRNNEERQKRLENERKFINRSTKDREWLNGLMQNMQERVMGMLDDLTVAFYFTADGELEIMRSGALMSRQLIKERQKKAEKTEQKRKVSKPKGTKRPPNNTTVADESFGQSGYVFGFLEHKDLMFSSETRYASSGKQDSGRRIIRPLRWYLNQPGTLIQTGELGEPKPRMKEKGINERQYPGLFIGVEETIQGVQLKDYSKEEKSNNDKATLMMKDLMKHIKMKLWLQVNLDNDLIEDRKRYVIDHYNDNIGNIEDDAVFFNALMRKYVYPQSLFPGLIPHEEGDMKKHRYSEFYESNNKKSKEATDKGYKSRKRALSEYGGEWPVPRNELSEMDELLNMKYNYEQPKFKDDDSESSFP